MQFLTLATSTGRTKALPLRHIVKIGFLMPFTVRLNHHTGSFIVMEGENILDAALRQGYFIPYSCHEGLCGTCEGQIIEGKVDYYNRDDLVLDEEELAAGKTLFCSATPRSDLLIEVPGIIRPTAQTATEFTYSLLSLQALNDQVYQATLAPMETTLDYLAGQYIEICLPMDEPKPFSIANAPLGDGHIQLHIRFSNDNDYAVKLIQHLKEQKTLTFRGAFGHCLHHPEPELATVMIAGGTGFAPLKAIIEQSLSVPLAKPLTLYWTAKTRADLYLHELAEQWDRYIPNFRYVPVLTGSSIPSDWSGKRGSVYAVIHLDQPQGLDQHHVYISGPPSLTFDAFEKLAPLGVKHYHLYSDAIDYV